MVTEKDYKGLVELSAKRYTKYYDFIRHLMLIAAGLVGILVSLKSGKSETGYEYLTFVIAISGLGIGIMFGSISLYAEINSLDKGRKLYAERLIEINKGKAYQLPFDTVDKNILFKIAEYICFSSFSLAMISLIIYGVLKG